MLSGGDVFMYSHLANTNTLIPSLLKLVKNVLRPGWPFFLVLSV